jgi:uncharacterized repeat protein (TIGR01451 family)
VTATFAAPAEFICPPAWRIAASVESCCEDPVDTGNAVEVHVPCLSITKTDGRETAVAGDRVLYTIVVKNEGAAPVAGARLTDTFPGDLVGVKWCRGQDCDPIHDGNLMDVIPPLPVGGEETYRAAGTLRQVCAGELINTASVEPPGGCGKDAADRTLILPSCPDAALTCEEIAGFAVEGGTIVKTFVIRNAGPDVYGDNAGPEFIDILPAALTPVSAAASSGTVTIMGNTVTWNGSIPVGEEVTVEITATVAAGTLGTTICNMGTVFLDGDGNGEDDHATCCFTVVPMPPIPSVSGSGLVALALLLAALAMARLRQRGTA